MDPQKSQVHWMELVYLPTSALPETNSSHLQPDGWKTKTSWSSFLLGWLPGRYYVSGSVPPKLPRCTSPIESLVQRYFFGEFEQLKNLKGSLFAALKSEKRKRTIWLGFILPAQRNVMQPSWNGRKSNGFRVSLWLFHPEISVEPLLK